MTGPALREAPDGDGGRWSCALSSSQVSTQTGAGASMSDRRQAGASGYTVTYIRSFTQTVLRLSVKIDNMGTQLDTF